MNKAQRIKMYRKGVWAERLCAVLLTIKGYKIMARRYKCRMGEIDIIARKGSVLVAVEVKAYKELQNALDAVTPKSQSRIIRALEHFIMKNPQYSAYDMRFDVMAVLGGCLIRHLDNAFRPST